MYLESFIKHQGNLTVLRNCLSQLFQVNAFAVFAEIGRRRNLPQASPHPLEHSAMRAAFADGYDTAINDMFYFFERFVDKPQEHFKQKMDFGALAALKQAGDISEEEYEQLTKSKSGTPT